MASGVTQQLGAKRATVRVAKDGIISGPRPTPESICEAIIRTAMNLR